MKTLILIAATMILTACGTDDRNDSYSATSAPQIKVIDAETLQDYDADRISAVPFCAHSCEVLELSNGQRFFCMETGGDWIAISGTHECELGK